MSLNTSNTPDGRGVIIYNGEIILLFVREVNLSFDKYTAPEFKGTKKGNLYLTSHRIIFNNVTEPNSNFKSLSMPFVSLRGIKLEQPIFGANYLHGELIAQPDGNWQGEASWRLTFKRGGCIDFGQALLKSEEMTQNYARRPFDAPPQYAPPAGDYYAAPPTYYWTGGNYNGYQAPTHVFNEQPPAESVYMWDCPPPYPGMGQAVPNPPPQNQTVGSVGPSAPPYPAGGPPQYPTSGTNGGAPYPAGNTPYPTLGGTPYPASNPPYPAGGPPSYNQATALPQKVHTD
uniref:GRAM domain-containing protein n=2 Tax=Meloidogyne TaxID=189290 RepID=A0A6V7W474_MELEN|nr:unnamed protein product [Meloidogyne enterolobii]